MCIRDRDNTIWSPLVAADVNGTTIRLRIENKEYTSEDEPVSYTHLDVYKRQGMGYDIRQKQYCGACGARYSV